MRDVYYDDEIRYLKEEGARFARKYPRRAKYLNLESAQDRDPLVETLFEGFAFLCAGIRERIDDTLPELAGGLTGMLWPELLHPIPSICVVEFKPRFGMLQNEYIVKKGTAMFTDLDSASNIGCRFATLADVSVNPISIDKAIIETNAGGKDVLSLTFKIDHGIRPEALTMSPIRVFINDDLSSALMIREMLLRHVEETILKSGDDKKTLIPEDTFLERGFDEDENLFPESQSVIRPLSLLRDYFAFPEKFLFIDILGLNSLSLAGKSSSTLTLEIRFDRKISNTVRITKDSFKLHCALAANVFRRDAEPIFVDGRKSEYRLVSDAVRPDCYAIHSVISVTGIDGVSGARREYDRYGKLGGVGDRFYSTRRERYSEDSRHQTTDGMTLSMNGRQTEDGRLKRETLHIETWQTNGTLARKILTEGGLLRKASPTFPDYISFSNITVPTRPINPPPDGKYLWTFLSHLSCAYSNFSDAARLKDFLRTYDWTDAGEKRHEIEAIRSVSIKPCDMAVDRAVIRGMEMNVVIDETTAERESVFLFGTVLARSLSCMASINTFLKLTFTMSVSGKCYVWHCRSGERWTV